MPFQTTVSKFGLRLKRDRKAAGLTVRQLANSASISYSYITKLETERPASGVSFQVVRALANALQSDELEYVYLCGLLPTSLSHLLSTSESRRFIRATMDRQMSADDWKDATTRLECRAKKQSSRRSVRPNRSVA